MLTRQKTGDISIVDDYIISLKKDYNLSAEEVLVLGRISLLEYVIGWTTAAVDCSDKLGIDFDDVLECMECLRKKNLICKVGEIRKTPIYAIAEKYTSEAF